MNSKMIDITMPTTLRPSLLDRTLESFTKKIFMDKDRYRFIFNVDPIGERGCKSEDVVSVAYKYFDNILYNIAEEPSFPRAFKWCWNHAETEFIFHMNEDWELVRSINIDDMIDILKNNSNIACLRLLKLNVPKNLKFFRSMYVDKGQYLQAENRAVSCSTNPQLIKKAFYTQARKYLLDDANPEKQFRSWHKKMFENVTRHWDYAVYAKIGDKASIKDIGEEWKKKHGYIKNGESKFFTKWEKSK